MGAQRTPMDQARPIPADWLSLREPADARARETTREAVAGLLAHHRPQTIVDVGSGTGAGARWLAGVMDGADVPGGADALYGDQRWVLIDHDEALLRTAADGLREAGVRGPITEVVDDLGCLGRVLDEAADADSPAVVITSALLDLLTAEQLRALVEDTATRGTPLLSALTVTGGMELGPSEATDEVVRTAFDAHQRHGERLGPDAAVRARQLAVECGLDVREVETPWLLDASAAREEAGLIERLLRDRAEAAVEELEHRGDAAAVLRVRDWLETRLAQTHAGDLRLQIDHVDLIIGVSSPH